MKIAAVTLLASTVGLATAAVPSLPSFVAQGRFSWTTSKLDVNVTFVKDPARELTGIGIGVHGTNYFMMAEKSGRSYMSIGDPKSEFYTCRSEPGAVFKDYVLDFLPKVVPTGQSAAGFGYYPTTQADVYSYNATVCWISMVPTFGCSATVYIPSKPAPGIPPVLGFTLRGTLTGVPNEVTVAYDTMEVSPAPSSFPSDVDIPDRCVSGPPPRVCPEAPVVPRFKSYKNVPASTGLVDENSADAVGEALWLCWHTKDNKMSSVVTEFHTATNTTWGLYAQCNVKECMNPSPQTLTVGRQLSGSNKPTGDNGQCTNNDDSVGSWFSWPSSTMCGPDNDPSDGSCAWKSLGASKSITVQCLDKVGFYDACGAPTPPAARRAFAHSITDTAMLGGDPFLDLVVAQHPGMAHVVTGSLQKAGAILTQAFASDDPSQGGCPNINTPQRQ